VDIRRLTESDVPMYRALRRRALVEHPEAFLSDLEDEDRLTDDDWSARFRPGGPGSTYGAFDEDGSLVGVVTTLRETRRKTAHKASIVGMHVAAERQGRGIGRTLLDHALGELFTAREVEVVQLCVTSGNAAARRLYTSAGFVTYGIERDAARVGNRSLDHELMAMRLNPNTAWRRT
jgi:ribosomal protein S18 acetylase RimI-like enzyme